MNLAKIFPIKIDKLPNERFGFKEKAELFVTKDHTKLIGHKIEFNLPSDYVSVVPVGPGEQFDPSSLVVYSLSAETKIQSQEKISKSIRGTLSILLGRDIYTGSDFKDLEVEINSLRDFERKKADLILIHKKDDTLIRRLIKNPETYSKPQSYWPFPVVYVGQKRVIVCAHHVE